MRGLGRSADSELTARRLRSVVKGAVLADRASRLLYAADASIYRIVPTVVVQPRDAEDVQATVLLAAELGLPIAPRGAGTGLAGESLTVGIVLDFTRYMTSIASTDDPACVCAEPGAILDRIAQVGTHGYRFGPDPSSASRATVGGSIGNNATGAHSMRYGFTGQHIRRMEIVTADGAIHTIDGATQNALTEQLHRVLWPKRSIIASHWPKVARNRAGYNLNGAMNASSIDLIKLLAGSEGTLAIVTKAWLNLVPTPKSKVVLQANFGSLALMGRSLRTILPHDPSMVELMDDNVLRLARQAYPELKSLLPEVAASLMIEFDGASAEECASRLGACHRALQAEFGSHVALAVFTDPKQQSQQFEARKRAVPLLYRQGTSRQPVPAIEDIAVPAEHMEEYVVGVEKLFRQRNLSASFYAHAGPGELHIRPFLDLRSQDDRRTLASLAREVYELAWSLGGTISGEHGVGLLRGWAMRRQYGPAVDAMIDVKRIFDPDNRLNPGKVLVDESDLPMTSLKADVSVSNRVCGGAVIDGQVEIDLGEVFDAATVCNGCGECKGVGRDQRMCPVFRATNDEAVSPRGRAAVLREFLSGNLSERELLASTAGRSIDLCVLCGNCARECPSGVDVASLVVEARAMRRTMRRSKVTELFFANIDRLMGLMALFAPITNRVANHRLMKEVMSRVFGVAMAHDLPRFEMSGLLTTLRKRIDAVPVVQPRTKAVWFVDMAARYQRASLAEAMIRVCAANGITLIVPPQKPAGVTHWTYGRIDEVRAIAQYNLRHLDDALADADMILCAEPTATTALTIEYPKLLNDSRSHRIAEVTRDATIFFSELASRNELTPPTCDVSMHLAYHCPCHMRQITSTNPGAMLLNHVAGVRVDMLPSVCCGLSGTFGMQQSKYDLSLTMAEELQRAIATISPEAVCSECTSCQMQLSHISGRRAIHPLEILAKAYGA